MSEEERDEQFPPEIERALTIERMRPPSGGFKPFIKPEDLAGLDKRDQKLLLAFSVLEQKVDFYGSWVERNNHHQRNIEAQIIVAKRAQDKDRLRWQVLTWIGTSVIAAAIAAAINKFF